MLLVLLPLLFKRIIDRGSFNSVDSFLGGAVNFGSDIPSYGSIGSGYDGDFFGGSNIGGGLNNSLIQGLSRNILGGLVGGSSRGISGSLQGGPYVSQARNNMQNLLGLALSSFQTPRSVI